MLSERDWLINYPPFPFTYYPHPQEDVMKKNILVIIIWLYLPFLISGNVANAWTDDQLYDIYGKHGVSAFGMRHECIPGGWCPVSTKKQIDNNMDHARITVVAIDDPDCAYCKVMRPVIYDLAQEYKGRVQFLKLHPIYNSKLEKPFPMTGTPKYIFFLDGKDADYNIDGAPVGAGLEASKKDLNYASMKKEDKIKFLRPYGKKHMKDLFDRVLVNINKK